MYKKRYLYKIYSRRRSLWDVDKWDATSWLWNDDFETVWQDELTPPTFNSAINGGVGALTVKLARPYTSFGEGEDVTLGNLVKIYVYDKESPNGQLLYTGYINAYSTIIENNKQYIEVEIWGLSATLNDFILEDTLGNTAITYNSYDPSDMVKNIVDKFRASGGELYYTDDSIDTSNTEVSYTFNLNTIQECLDKAVELAPDNYYYYVDPNNVLYFKESSDIPDHKLAMGRHISGLRTTKSVNEIINRVYFLGGYPTASGQVYYMGRNESSESAYNRKAKKIIDERVLLNSTASLETSRILARQSSPKTVVEIEVIDSNGNDDNIGYDIESLTVGDTLQLANVEFEGSSVSKWNIAKFDIDVWDNTIQASQSQVLQILSIKYEGNGATVIAGLEVPMVAKRIEDIRRNLENFQTYDAPVAPTT
jgi:hypothetical protein